MALEQQILQALVVHHQKLRIVSAWPGIQRAIDDELSRMEARGLIKRHEDETRAYRITDAGRAALALIKAR